MVEPHITRFATGPTQVARSMPSDRLSENPTGAPFRVDHFRPSSCSFAIALLAKGAWGGLGARRAERGEEMSLDISSSVSMVIWHVRSVLFNLDSEPYTLSLGTTLSVCARVLARTVEHEEELSSLPRPLRARQASQPANTLPNPLHEASRLLSGAARSSSGWAGASNSACQRQNNATKKSVGNVASASLCFDNGDLNRRACWRGGALTLWGETTTRGPRICLRLRGRHEWACLSVL